MVEILKEHGLILHGNCVVNEFTFERPFVLWGGVSVQNVVGGGSYINARTSIENASIGRYCAIAHDTKIGLLRHDSAAVMMTSLDAFFGQSSFGSDENAKIAPTSQENIRPKRTNIGHGV